MESKNLSIHSDNVKIVRLDIPFWHLASFILKLYLAWIVATFIMIPILLILFYVVVVIFQQ